MYRRNYDTLKIIIRVFYSIAQCCFVHLKQIVRRCPLYVMVLTVCDVDRISSMYSDNHFILNITHVHSLSCTYLWYLMILSRAYIYPYIILAIIWICNIEVLNISTFPQNFINLCIDSIFLKLNCIPMNEVRRFCVMEIQY